MAVRWMVYALALLLGCGEDGAVNGEGGEGGDGEVIARRSSVTPGLWVGGTSASNADGTPFETGWAICFHVNLDGTALTPSPDCDVDGDDDETWPLEVSWKGDVGADPETHELSGCEGHGLGISGDEASDGTTPIVGNAFRASTHGAGIRVLGWILDGGRAVGLASYSFHPGMGPGVDCELLGGWEAQPLLGPP